MFRIEWKKTDIGEFSDVSSDMWYLEGAWTPNETAASKEFEEELSSYDPKTMLHDPERVQKVILFSNDGENRKIYSLVMSLKENRLSMRQVVAEAALDKFFPDRL